MLNWLNLPCDHLSQIDLILSDDSSIFLELDKFLHWLIVPFTEESKHGQMLIQMLHSYFNLVIDILVVYWVSLDVPEELISDVLSLLKFVEPCFNIVTHTVQESILNLTSNRLVNSFLDDSLSLTDTENNEVANQKTKFTVLGVLNVNCDQTVI